MIYRGKPGKRRFRGVGLIGFGVVGRICVWLCGINVFGFVGC